MGRKPKVENTEKVNKIKELMKDFPIKFASDIKNDPKIRTGIFALDYVLGGGISQCEGGHRIEFYGKESSFKTTMSLLVAKRYQELGKKCVFVDVEESFDVDWAKKLGVDTKKLAVAQPQYHEQTGDLLVELIPEFDLIITDSVASMIPKAEFEGSLEQRNMALQAQLNAPLTRKLYATIKGQSTTMIFLNQIREKVGIMYGCVHGDTNIPLVNGESITISELVKNRKKVCVWSYDERKKKIVSKKVSGWHINGKTNEYISINSKSIDTKNGVSSVTVTPNHRVLTSTGWKEAKNLNITDNLITKVDFELSSSNEIKTTECCITSIVKNSKRKLRNKIKYDISIENGSNYLAGNTNNGFIIHNSPETTPGGRSLKHFYNTIIRFRPSDFIEVNKEKIGIVNTLQCKKNKKGKPNRTSSVDFYYEGYFDNKKSLLFAAIKYGLVKRAGAWYNYGEKKFQGEKGICQELEPEQWGEIEKEVWKYIK